MGGARPARLRPAGSGARDQPAEAETVRTLFRLYREIGTVKRLKEATDRRELVTKRRQLSSGRSTAAGRSRAVISTACSATRYTSARSGSQACNSSRSASGAIITARRSMMSSDNWRPIRIAAAPTTNTTSPSLLTGLIYDETGTGCARPTRTKRASGTSYYISKRLMHKSTPTTGGWPCRRRNWKRSYSR